MDILKMKKKIKHYKSILFTCAVICNYNLFNIWTSCHFSCLVYAPTHIYNLTYTHISNLYITLLSYIYTCLYMWFSLVVSICSATNKTIKIEKKKSKTSIPKQPKQQINLVKLQLLKCMHRVHTMTPLPERPCQVFPKKVNRIRMMAVKEIIL